MARRSSPTRPSGPRPASVVPDRSLTPDESLPTMAIRASGGHTFVYRKMVEGPIGAAAPNHGDLVRVVDRDAQHVGYALYNGRSQIALRLLSRGATPPGPEFWARRIDEAAALRQRRCSAWTARPTPTASSTPRGTASPA